MTDQSHGPEHGSPTTPDHAHTEAHQVEDSLHVEKWEGIWLRIASIMVVVFVLAIVISATAFCITVPGVSGRVNPADLNNPDNPFSQPGLRELAPGKYEAYIVGQTWSFLPDRIEVPVGSEVTFHMTARDVTHGLKLAGTNVNVMLLPGQISTLSARFDTPGTYNYICHEYCGYVAGSPIGHHTMYGQLIAVPTDTLTTTSTLTGTATMTESAPVADTAPITETAPVTGMAPVADTASVTGTAGVTETGTVDETGTVTMTETAPVTTTAPVTETGTLTATN